MPFTPFHLSRSFPHFKATSYGFFRPTPLKSLYKAREIAKSNGLKHVYLGNLQSSEYEHTICPQCSRMVIKRSGFGIKELKIDKHGNCKYCGFPICMT